MHSHSTADRECARIAKRQHGVIERQQALKAGLTKRAIELRLSAGRLEVLLPCVYGLPGTPDCWEKRLMAAYLWAQPSAVVSHRSAAQLLGLDGPTQGYIELSAPTSRKPREGITLHRLAKGDRPRHRAAGCFTFTAPERTVFDLCSALAPPKVGKALDDALRKRMTTLPRLWTELENKAQRGRKGSAVFRQLLQLRDDRDGRLESDLEAAALRLLRTRRLPKVEVQFVVTEAGAHAPRLDFAYPRYKVGVEAHSYKHHGGADPWNSDWARDNRLKVLGWTVLHYTRDEFHFEGDRVISDIGAVLRSRGAELIVF
jgi:very-short-patch-repair endonuclease